MIYITGVVFGADTVNVKDDARADDGKWFSLPIKGLLSPSLTFKVKNTNQAEKSDDWSTHLRHGRPRI